MGEVCTSTTMDKEHHENSWWIHSFSVGRYDRSGIFLTYVKDTISDHWSINVHYKSHIVVPLNNKKYYPKLINLISLLLLICMAC